MRQANLDSEEAAATTGKTFGEGGRERQVYSFLVKRSRGAALDRYDVTIADGSQSPALPQARI